MNTEASLSKEELRGKGGAVAFAELADRVRARVDARLAERLDAAVESARSRGADALAAIDALRSLALRGGKRLRAVLVAAGYGACGGDPTSDAAALAGASVELLQAYLLIHDDWMDGDDTRRGGPSVHAMLREACAEHGDAAAILAGDFASAMAQRALLEIPAPAERVLEAARELARIQEEVVSGQLLDLRGGPGASVELVHDLKTGSYTVRGPLAIGAILAGASADQRKALDAFAAPLGLAFQLRDDLLGVFGQPESTGKPAGNDLRRGKRTALVAELAGDEEGLQLLARVFGHQDAPRADLDAVVARMVTSGAKARVEDRLAGLLTASRRALESAPFAPKGRDVLEGAIAALGERER